MMHSDNQATKPFLNLLPHINPHMLENLFCLGRKVLAESNKMRALQVALNFAGEQSDAQPVGMFLFCQNNICKVEPPDATGDKDLLEQALLFAERCRHESQPAFLSLHSGTISVAEVDTSITENMSDDALLSIPIIKHEKLLGVAIFFINVPPTPYAFSLLKAFGAFIADTAISYLDEFKGSTNISRLEKELRSQFEFSNFVGHNHQIIELLHLVSMVAPSDATILIQCETGTGKDVLARSIHANSNRKDKIFIPINCGAIPEQLLESELFGHTKGAFTSATDDRIGWFEKAHAGTVFLDEISEMSPALQVKLLHILQTGEFSRVGSTEIQHTDVRILAATNKDLNVLIEREQFRNDLYYRLNVIDLKIPPLRERKDDIPVLTRHFMQKFAKKYEKQFSGITRNALNMLKAHDYPGNCRELENIIQAAVIFAGNDNELKSSHLKKLNPSGSYHGSTYVGIHGTFKDSKQFVVEQFERQFIRQKLEASSGNISQAARSSGMDVKNFHTKMSKYGIDATSFK